MTSSETAVNIVGNVNITGQLNVDGEYNATSTNIATYDDAFIKVNNGNSEVDAGLIVETAGAGEGARVFYDVSENHWKAGEDSSYSQIIRLTDAVADGNANKEKVLKTTAAGLITVTNINLAAVGSAIATTDTTSVSVPTIGQVATFGNLWGGSAKTVSTSDPSGGNDGDFWFKYEA